MHQVWRERKVKVSLKKVSGGSVSIDSARTSDNGGWTATNLVDAIAPQGPFSAVVAKAAVSKVKVSKDRTLVCKSDKLKYPLDD